MGHKGVHTRPITFLFLTNPISILTTTMKHLIFISSLFLAASSASAQALYISFDNDAVIDEVSKKTFDVSGVRTLPYVQGVSGSALRLDGYSNYVKAQGISYSAYSQTALTVSMWCAAETYPMMTAEAENTPTFTTLAGNIDDSAKSGFAFLLNSQGGLQFKCYLKSWPLICEAKNVVLPKYKWNYLCATIDKDSNKLFFYLNGEQVGTAKCPYELTLGSAPFMIGKSSETMMGDGFHLNTFNGLMDEIKVENKVKGAEEIHAEYTAASQSLPEPELAVPVSAWEDNIWRPRFHGMPSHGWTNECHGMTYSDGKYHVFFQKNGNGPYMARLHWGHISSPDLCQWTEEPIAIAPAEAYDIKGCWSGCVFSDPELTSGKPAILYTAVDNARATICEATPADESLIAWNKATNNPLINGRPSGLSDDFRDPYFFTANGEKYIIVGTSKDGKGACTLHKWNGSSWSNDGSIFFQTDNATLHGRFWEMPNVTPMGDDRYLFTCTPLDANLGVRTLCWVGTIGEDGKFTPTSDVQYIEMEGMSKDGYGLLSPTFYQKDGKTIMLGIVPDKLPTSVNLQMGWAHNYSLPREISLAADGTIVQRPYSGISALRATSSGLTRRINGTEPLDIKGRQVEIDARFTVGEGVCGVSFLKGSDGKAMLSYNPAHGTVTLDLTTLPREVNDNAYGGIYTASLPKRVAAGETLNLHVYVDGSIADIFVNDTWAFSVRIFPTKSDCEGTEVFAEQETDVSVNAWVLTTDAASFIDNTFCGKNGNNDNGACYDLNGRRLGTKACRGVYIVNGKKFIR